MQVIRSTTGAAMDTSNGSTNIANTADLDRDTASRHSFQSDSRFDTQIDAQIHHHTEKMALTRQPTGTESNAESHAESNMGSMRNASDIVARIALRVKKLLFDEIPRPRPLSALSHSSSRHSTNTTPPKSPSSPSIPKPLPLRISSLGRSQQKRPKIAPRTGSDGIFDEVRTFIHNVAKEVAADATTMTLFMSSPDIQKLAQDFFGSSKDRSEKPSYTAETLFWNLQYIEGGDLPERPWIKSRPSKRDWQTSDHLTRFILLAEKARLRDPNSRWQTRDMPFEDKVNFYLCVLRCFAFREKYIMQ